MAEKIETCSVSPRISGELSERDALKNEIMNMMDGVMDFYIESGKYPEITEVLLEIYGKIELMK